MSENRHQYTCLEAPEELQKFGLTRVVCRVDMREHFHAAFASPLAASIMCDQLNGFAKQDDPSLFEESLAEKEIAEANRLAAEREKESELAKKLEEAKQDAGKAALTKELSLADKVKLAQEAVAQK